MARIKVVWTGEGTYPYATGGVSTWADILIKELKNIDFILMPIMMHPYMQAKYEIPPNVVDTVNVPLWGTEEPTEYIRNIEFSRIYKAKIKTQEHKDIARFEPILIKLLNHIYQKEEDFEGLGYALVEFYDYFLEYDYYEIFRSEEVWEIYKHYLIEHYKDQKNKLPTVFDMIEGLRYLFRFFISLLPELPKADIYHSSAAAFCGLPCIIAKIKHKSKFLLTEHGIYIREQYLFASRNQTPIKTKEFLLGLIKTVSRLNYHFADVISPVCEYNKRWERKWGAQEEKIKTIYNGIDVLKFQRFEVEREKRPSVVMVARVDPLKDVETFIRCCGIVAKRVHNVHFKLYGPEVDKEYMLQCKMLVKELGIESNFSFMGPTSNPARAYNEADVVMLTSISEAFPFAVIEAMACERVVVSSDVGGTKEVLEGYGFIVKPKDYEEFSKYVIYLLENPQFAKELGRRARGRILNGFTIEDMVDNYWKLYRELYESRQNA
ncbi:GT4 family glycosyltransferase PelF [Nitratiruptor tergarcus]|uniref:Glycosyltransferase involved in cell wall bisynthesis n=1 Tax=Nitratiruptor tergarcus DSM 16512 TaxID=1069081 RepID=A0A1W1WWC1_9BACT|nr:GT4 family glycosyltransferase PelF [Nitratiruptor tergarcus]SMC10043.1 Glycosyltransferase involved in cell wall bisynthesis [Nitratiruptor tergarcus DSM 16512]